MDTVRFLARFFKPYWPQAIGALIATVGYAASSVLLVACFQVVLSEVIQTDAAVDGMPGVGIGGAPVDGLGGGDAESGEEDSPFDMSANLMDVLLGGYQRLKLSLGIDETNVVFFVPLGLVLIMLLRSISQFGNGYLFQLIGLSATNDLRNRLYERILGQSSRFFANHPSGELVSRVSNDIVVIQSAVSTRFVDLFQQLPTLIGLIWMLFSIHAKLAGITLLVVPAIVVPIVRFGRGMRRTSHRSQERLADVANLVAEAVRGHRVVKAFGMEGFEVDRFRQATRRHLTTRLKAQLLSYTSTPVIETLAAIGAGSFLVYAGGAVRRGELAPSMLVTFLFALLALYEPVRKLNKVNLTLQEALAAGQRVQRVVEAPRDIDDAPDASMLPEMKHGITFDDVSFGYERDTVLHAVSTTIHRGEVVALVGHSGAGKSTLVNLLPRFFDPDAGAVRIDDQDLRSVTLSSLRAQIGIVTQDTVLFNDTVRNNIAYGRSDLPQAAVEDAARAAYADTFIRELPEGYDTVIGEGGLKLSGGQRQRIAIARAILKDPPILILDEATSHLDSEAEALVQKALSNLMRGRTALVIAHRLSTIRQADRILVMDRGRIVESGPHEELLALDGVYKRLYDLQFRNS
ncbi:MAG: ABC transporter ATP-binding protein [Acidobacteriota bacterium]